MMICLMQQFITTAQCRQRYIQPTSTQIISGKLKITLNVDDNINSAIVYAAFRNNGKIVDVKKATLSNLQAEVSLSSKTYTDMDIYIWNSRQQPYTYVKNIKK